MNAIQRLRSESTKIVRGPGGRFWQIQRVDSVQIAEHKLAIDIEVAKAARILHKELSDELERVKSRARENPDTAADIEAQLAAMGAEERKAHEEKLERQRRHDVNLLEQKQLELAERMLDTRDKTVTRSTKAYNAIVCAGVVGVQDESVLEGVEWSEDDYIVATQAEAIELAAKLRKQHAAECEATGLDVPPPPRVHVVSCDPVRLVMEDNLEDPDATPPRLAIRHLGEKRVAFLAEALKELGGTASSEVLSCFRPGSGLLFPGGRDRAAVRAAAERASDREAGPGDRRADRSDRDRHGEAYAAGRGVPAGPGGRGAGGEDVAA